MCVDLEMLQKAIRVCWDKDTCYPPMQDEWSEDNPACGQCYAVTLVVNDYLGGDILRYYFDEGADHFCNLIEGEVVDLTREQFDKDEVFPEPVVVKRKDAKDTIVYLILKKRVADYFDSH